MAERELPSARARAEKPRKVQRDRRALQREPRQDFHGRGRAEPHHAPKRRSEVVEPKAEALSDRLKNEGAGAFARFPRRLSSRPDRGDAGRPVRLRLRLAARVRISVYKRCSCRRRGRAVAPPRMGLARSHPASPGDDAAAGRGRCSSRAADRRHRARPRSSTVRFNFFQRRSQAPSLGSTIPDSIKGKRSAAFKFSNPGRRSSFRRPSSTTSASESRPGHRLRNSSVNVCRGPDYVPPESASCISTIVSAPPAPARAAAGAQTDDLRQ